jgi:Holliday junction DNA helicase RuvB
MNEKNFYDKLRPLTFEEYPGQDKVCEHLKIYTQAALLRDKPLDHCLLHGPPGLGKTTLAGIISQALNMPLRSTSGAIIEKVSDIVGILVNLEPGTILFIDEIHRVPRNVEEILYLAMEDYIVDVMVGQGLSARNMRMDLVPFTLIGATTQPSRLSAPLRDRFGIVEHLEYYNAESLNLIIQRNSQLLGMEITSDASELLSHRSRGTPRIANSLLKRIMDFALVKDRKRIDISIVEEALLAMEIDHYGLSKKDRMILQTIENRFKGGPVGIDSLAATLNEEPSTLEDIYEPYLIFSGYLQRTSRGRMLSDLGKSVLENR